MLCPYSPFPMLDGGDPEEAQRPMSRLQSRTFLLAVTNVMCLCIGFLGGCLWTDHGHINDNEIAATGNKGTPQIWAAVDGREGENVDPYRPPMNPAFDGEPWAKAAVRRFDFYLMNQAAHDQPSTKFSTVSQWLTEDFQYETVGFADTASLHQWVFDGEEMSFRRTVTKSSFTQMLFFGTKEMATTTSYGTVFWQGQFRGVPAYNNWTMFRVTDVYTARPAGQDVAKVNWNFMMIDWADLFRRMGRPVLPPAPLLEGLVLPPAADDAVPAPFSQWVKHRDSQAAERIAKNALFEDWNGAGHPDAAWWDADLTFYGPGGIGVARSREEYSRHVLAPYRAGFSERDVHLEVFGCEGNYCCGYGYLSGLHVGKWVGLAPSGRRVRWRFVMHWRVVDNVVKEGWMILNFPELFTQLGMDLFERAASQPVDQ